MEKRRSLDATKRRGAFFILASGAVSEDQMQLTELAAATTAFKEEDRALTVAEFCALERMSLTTYHKLKKSGHGPDEVRFPGMSFVRITKEARAEWHAKIEEWRKSEAVALEQQRRSAEAKRKGKLAAESPLHPTRRKQAKKKKAQLEAEKKAQRRFLVKGGAPAQGVRAKDEEEAMS